ncbi:MAG TPA: lytic transglycosylase domain-containing protein [Planctomycetota bacterium]|nr:lytic transglycosylase domain-containing protein [Planctomycetota bacterium]
MSRAARRRTTKRRARGSNALRNGLLAFAVLAVALAIWSPRPKLVRRWWSERQGIVRVESHAASIQAAARETGVDANLLAGVMMVESRGHVEAESKVGALGLFQLMLPTALERASLLHLPQPSRGELLRDGELNTRLGAHYLAWLLERFDGDEQRALIAYNAGPGRLKRWINEAGSYAAWRDARERAGNSDVLAYASNVQHYRQRFAERGVIAPTAVREVQNLSPDHEPSAVQAASSTPPDLVGPPAPIVKQ